MKNLSPIQRVGLVLLVLIVLTGSRGPAVSTAGPRELIVVRESAQETPAFATMVAALRSGPHAEYLKAQGHALLLLDPQDKDGDDRPAPAVTRWQAEYADLVRAGGRCLLIVDRASGKLLAKAPLAGGATAEDVMNQLKQHGG